VIPSEVRKVHFLQLDLISKIIFLLEDFLWFHNILRTAPKDFSTILTTPFKVDRNNELEYLSKRKLSQIKSDYRFPELTDFDISVDERKFLNKVLTEQAKLIREIDKKIVKFWRNHYKVYNVFKHGLSALTGMHQLIPYLNKEAQISSHIFIRSLEKLMLKNTKRKARNHPQKSTRMSYR
jgi:hypothetical protein